MLEGVRIIAGTYRSRVLVAPPGQATRPTSDRLRETLFNVLAPRIEGARFLDLYAGSGAVGLEALSRGAVRVTFVEREARALSVLRGNLERLGVESGFQVAARSVATFLRGKPTDMFDVVYLDPPWDAAEEYEATLGLLGGVGLDSWFGPQPPNARDQGRPFLDQDAPVIAEHRRKSLLKDRYGRLERTRLLEQGDAALSFYRIGELLK
jgi:16S rRNA (guanine(966)-N(2))-methyltransferase RsmD